MTDTVLDALEQAVAAEKTRVAQAAEPVLTAVVSVAAIDVAKLRAIMASVEHDVIGQCWKLWDELKKLAAEAESAVGKIA